MTWPTPSLRPGARLFATLSLLGMAGCPPVPEGVEQGYEAGVAAGYVQALDEIGDLQQEVDQLQAQIDTLRADVDPVLKSSADHETRIASLESDVDSTIGAIVTLQADLDVLEVDALRRGQVAIYPNETESQDDDSYEFIPDDGEWHQVPLFEGGCRFAYLKAKLRVAGTGPDKVAERGLWYAAGTTPPSDAPTPPFGGRGSLVHINTDAITPERADLAYVWVDMEAQPDLFIKITPDDAVGVGAATTSAFVAHMGCIQ